MAENCSENLEKDYRMLIKYFVNNQHAKTRSSHRWCSVKKVFLKILQIHRKTPVLESAFNNVFGLY